MFHVSLNSDRSGPHCTMGKWDEAAFEWKINKTTELRDEYGEERWSAVTNPSKSELQRQCENTHPAPLQVLSDWSQAKGGLS